MAPSLTGNISVTKQSALIKEPLQLKGVLEQFKYFDVTPIIGREFEDANLAEWLCAPNSDDLIRDLAITVSQCGVVFFRAQNDITNDLQKELIRRLGELSGKPKISGIHIHPFSNSARDNGGDDDEISIISSVQTEKTKLRSFLNVGVGGKLQSARKSWHSDITFEPFPSDYALLRLTELPKTGGDTLWASGYELFDRISRPYQKFLEDLTATYAQPGFKAAADNGGFKLYTAARGNPENTGDKLETIHPVIRTNPVTGWKSVFSVGHVQYINGLAQEESQRLLDWLLTMVVENHDLQVRHKWKNVNDLAICKSIV